MSQSFTKVRDSNFELLRIIAISMVLVLHADFFSLEGPSAADIRSDLFGSSMRILIQGLTIPAVDIFVMISGYYGIRHSKRGIFNLLFQTFFYLIMVYAVCIACGLSRFSVNGLEGTVHAYPPQLVSQVIYFTVYNCAGTERFCPDGWQAPIQVYPDSVLRIYADMGMAVSKVYRLYSRGLFASIFVWLYLLARYIRLYPIRLSQLKCGTYIILVVVIMITILSCCISTYFRGICIWLYAVAISIANNSGDCDTCDYRYLPATYFKQNNQQICHQQLCSVSGICKSKYTDTIPQFFQRSLPPQYRSGVLVVRAWPGCSDVYCGGGNRYSQNLFVETH